MSIFTAQVPPKLDELLNKLASDEEIQAVAKPSKNATTRGDYGRYMAVLPAVAEASPLASSPKANLRIWAVIFDRAGADRQGLVDALKIIEG
jgi:hypothetical protein